VWFDGDKKKQFLQKQIDLTKLSVYTGDLVKYKPMKAYLDKSKGYHQDGYNVVSHQEYGDNKSGFKRMVNNDFNDDTRRKV
jgi:hypothetical protein